jgi:hypothetical protein
VTPQEVANQFVQRSRAVDKAIEAVQSAKEQLYAAESALKDSATELYKFVSPGVPRVIFMVEGSPNVAVVIEIAKHEPGINKPRLYIEEISE